MRFACRKREPNPPAPPGPAPLLQRQPATLDTVQPGREVAFRSHLRGNNRLPPVCFMLEARLLLQEARLEGFKASSSWFDALRAREDLFDRLVDLDGSAAKFQRVLMDEEIAQRLSLADVAAMLGTTAADLTSLADGAELTELALGDKLADDPQPRLEVPPTAVLDTRPIFDAGREPLPAILDAAASLPEGGALLLVAPFHPVPLRRLLRQRGFASTAEQQADAWHVVFRHADAG